MKSRGAARHRRRRSAFNQLDPKDRRAATEVDTACDASTGLVVRQGT